MPTKGYLSISHYTLLSLPFCFVFPFFTLVSLFDSFLTPSYFFSFFLFSVRRAEALKRLHHVLKRVSKMRPTQIPKSFFMTRLLALFGSNGPSSELSILGNASLPLCLPFFFFWCLGVKMVEETSRAKY